MSTETRRAEYLGVAETAKLVRAALKQAFPDQRFSVRSDRYAGGASIDVRYLDGPLTEEVNRVVEPFRGADFDGMIDLKTHRGAQELPDGRLVYMGADYIFANRDVSQDFRATLVGRFEELYGKPFKAGQTYEQDLTPGYGNRSVWPESGETLIYRLAQVTRGPAQQRLPDYGKGDR